MFQTITISLLVLVVLSACTSNRYVLSDDADLWHDTAKILPSPKKQSLFGQTPAAEYQLTASAAQSATNTCFAKQIAQTKQTKITKSTQINSLRDELRKAKYSKNPKPKLYRKPIVKISDEQKNTISGILLILGLLAAPIVLGWLLGWLSGLLFASSGVGFAWAWTGAIIGGGVSLLVLLFLIVLWIIIPPGFHG